MKEQVIIAVLAAFLFSMGAGCASQERRVAEEATPAPVSVVAPETRPIKAKRAALPSEPMIKVKATVQAVDADKRVITLKSPKGEILDLKVEEDVGSLSQVKIGDMVVAKYYEWAVVRMAKAGEPMQAVRKDSVSKAEQGDDSSGVKREMQTVTARVEEIDHPRTHVTIRRPDGRKVKVFVGSPRLLRHVRAGDSVSITYVEALAVSMEKAE